LKLKPLLEKPTWSTRQKVQSYQVPMLKLQKQKLENSKEKILQLKKAQPSQIWS